jgi:D-glycero-D-manno-heptose 1,7-bisphosphate phosphatase
MEDASYFGDVDRVRIIPSAPAALKRLHDAGYRLFIVTNQSGVARRCFTREAVDQVHARLDAAFSAAAVKFDRYYICPHNPEDNCDCRKPQPRFLLEAAREYGLDLSQCITVGDRATDIQTGQNAGTKTALVLTGGGREALAKGDIQADCIADDITGVVDWILS